MSRRVLIAEDNDQFAELLSTFLSRSGWSVDRARDGAEALSKVVAAAPDLLLLDLKMPRLHGVEVLKKLRQSPRTRHLPVIVMSGVYRGEKYAAAARALGAAAYLEKPFKPSDLADAVKRTMAAAGAETFDRHLQRAFLSRLTGHLLLRHDAAEYSLTFISGTPVFVRPGFAFRDFGNWLHQRGFLSADEYAYYAGPGQLRHDLPVQMGCIAYPALLEEKLAYLSAELVAAFALPAMSVEEHPFSPPPGLQLLTVNVPQIFYQGYHQHLSPAARNQLLADDGPRYAALAPGYFRQVNFLSLTGPERELLPRLDGSLTLAEALAGEADLMPLAMTLKSLEMLQLSASPRAAVPTPEFPLRALFNAPVEPSSPPLAEVSLESFTDLLEGNESPIELAPEAAPAEATEDPLAARVRTLHTELQGKSYYEIFGLTPGSFAVDKLKERYFALTREFGPDVLMQLAGEEAALVEAILAAVAEAYNTLSDVVRKENYDQLLGSDRVGLGQKGDDRFRAEVQSQSGKVFIEMEEWDNAERALQDACNIDPDSGDYLAHLAWSIYRNPKNAASRALQEKARQLLNRALALERTAAGFAFKGWMLFEAGQDGLAEGEFNKALKLDARLLTARKGLRALREKQEQERKGLFRRIFG